MKSTDWKKAYTPSPALEQRVAATLSTLKEDQPMKFTIRTLAICALVIVCAMSLALAANQFGWVNFFNDQYGIEMPATAADKLNATEPVTVQVGPMTFTYKQLLYDQHLVLSACDVALTDSSEALYAMDADFSEAIGAGSDVVANKYNLDPKTTWIDTAKQLNLPLYGVRGDAAVNHEAAAESMSDVLWNEDGTLTYLSMPLLYGENIPETLPVTLYMAVHTVNTENGEVTVNQWREEKEITLTAIAMDNEAAYLPAEKNTLTAGGKTVTVRNIQAKQYATGIYYTLTCEMAEGMDENEVLDALYGEMMILDTDGNELPMGLNLSISANVDALPVATLEIMTNETALPARLLVTANGEQLVLENK